MEELSEYLVLYQIGGAGDPEVWRPGSKIMLTPEKATAYLAAGLVRAIETTKPLPEPEPVTVVHEGQPEAPTKRKRGGE